MTDNLERLRTELADVKLSAQLRLDRLVEANDRLEEERANSKRLQEALAAAEAHLANVLVMLAELHPDDRCRALDKAMSFYNERHPEAMVEPVAMYVSHLVHRGPLVALRTEGSTLEALLAETRKKALEEAAAHLMQVSDAMWERCETQRPTESWARPPAAEKEDAVTAWCFQRAADAIRALAEEVRT